MSEVTVSTPEPDSGSEATALAAGAAAANAQHAQATADEAQATAEAAQATAEAALRMPAPGLTAEEVRQIAAEAAREAINSSTPTEPAKPEAEEISVPEVDPPPSEVPAAAPAPNPRRGHPLMRAFLGRKS